MTFALTLVTFVAWMAAAALQPGDRVMVTTHSRANYVGTVDQVTDASVTLVVSNGNTVAIPLGDVDRVTILPPERPVVLSTVEPSPALRGGNPWYEPTFQGQVSIGAIHRGRGFRGQIGAFFGRSWMEQPRGRFHAIGIDATGDQGLYSARWSVGPSGRIGTHWPSRRGRAAGVYVFGRVTPFVEVTERDVGRQTVGGGVRLGAGVTAPEWTLYLLKSLPHLVLSDPDLCSFPEGTVLVIVSAAALILVNHLELTVEVASNERGRASGGVGFRIGLGF